MLRMWHPAQRVRTVTLMKWTASILVPLLVSVSGPSAQAATVLTLPEVIETALLGSSAGPSAGVTDTGPLTTIAVSASPYTMSAASLPAQKNRVQKLEEQAGSVHAAPRAVAAAEP
jgi:hypothetical protein